MHSKPHGLASDEAQDPGHPSLWRPQPGRFTGDQLVQAMIRARLAGPAGSHDRQNVLWKIDRLVSGDPDALFGLSGLAPLDPPAVLGMVAMEAGFDPDPTFRDGDVPIDPWRVLAACELAGARLAEAAAQGERVVLATGHPAGLIMLSMAVARLLEVGGAEILRPAAGRAWKEGGRHREIRYVNGVAVLTDRGGTLHTHAPAPMQLMLEAARPDLVVGDHGFAGAAIEAGIDTISVADVNDPALVVAKHQGRTDIVIVMDDNVQPEGYWPCFQAMASRFD